MRVSCVVKRAFKFMIMSTSSPVLSTSVWYVFLVRPPCSPKLLINTLKSTSRTDSPTRSSSAPVGYEASKTTILVFARDNRVPAELVFFAAFVGYGRGG